MNSVIAKQSRLVLVVLRIIHAVPYNITDTLVLPLGCKYVDAKKFFFLSYFTLILIVFSEVAPHSSTGVAWYIAGLLDQSPRGKYCPKISSIGLED